MKKLNIYYHIVPINDGYTFLCQNRNTGELYLWKKVLDKNPDALFFSSKRAAEEWIASVVPQECFEAEWFATVETVEMFSDISKSGLAELGYNFEVGM